MKKTKSHKIIMFVYVTFVHIFFSSMEVLAQYNLVANSGFEDLGPNYVCDVNGTNSSQTDLEDFFSMNSVKYWQIPDRRFFIFCERAATSDVICDGRLPGVIAHSGSHFAYLSNHEYLRGSLNVGIQQGHYYYVEFYFCQLGNTSPNGAGLRFLNGRPEQCGFEPLHNEEYAHISVPSSITNDGVYHKVSGIFYADKNYDSFAIGRFQGPDGYMLFDDFKIFDLGNDFCLSTWLFENTTFENEQRIYQASDQIIAGEDVDPDNINGSVIVKSNAHVIFKAGNQIVLEPGFSTEDGAYFETVIEPCSANPCPYIPPSLNDVVICDPNSVSIGNAAAETGLYYSWSPATYLNDPNSPNPVFTPPAGSGDIDYTVTITSICGYFFDYGFPPSTIPSITETVHVSYHTTPDPNPSVSITNVQTDDYSFNVDFTVSAETETYCIQIEEISSGGVIYSDCFNVTSANCCNFSYNYSMIPTFYQDLMSACKDYSIIISTKNYCFENVAVESFIWDRSNQLIIHSVANTFSAPCAPNEYLTAIVEGADEVDVYIANPSQSEIHDETMSVTSTTVNLWDGWCDGASCTSFFNSECWAPAGYYFYTANFTNKCGDSQGASGLIFLFHDDDGDPNNTDACEQALLNCTRMALIEEEPPTEIFNATFSELILIYPNPSTGVFNIEFSGSDPKKGISLIVYDNIGRVVLSQNYFSSTIDLSSFAKGIYYLEVTSELQTFREKIIKE